MFACYQQAVVIPSSLFEVRCESAFETLNKFLFVIASCSTVLFSSLGKIVQNRKHTKISFALNRTTIFFSRNLTELRKVVQAIKNGIKFFHSSNL